jgi:hypothetical protein
MAWGERKRRSRKRKRRRKRRRIAWAKVVSDVTRTCEAPTQTPCDT